MSLLSVKNLSLVINNKKLLNDLTFDLRENEILGIMGESGSGKTLTANSISRIHPSSFKISGKIFLQGINILELSEKKMTGIRGKKISMIFQEPMTALNPLKSIQDQVAEVAQIHLKMSYSEARKLALEKLERVGLPKKLTAATRYPHELSGGQRQRVMIAIAIAVNPKLLIADEPTTALDVTTQLEILSLLKDLVSDENLSIILISHDVRIIANVTNTILIIKSGRIIEKGPTQRLFTEQNTTYIRMLLENSKTSEEFITYKKEIVIVDVRDLYTSYETSYRYLKKPSKDLILLKVSFKIFEGECLALIGESGCGKSTLVKSILGLINVEDGLMTFNGTTIRLSDPFPLEFRRKMQIVFQDPYNSFNPKHKVKKIISEPLFLSTQKFSKQEIHNKLLSSIKSVGLSSTDLEKYPHQFSGGQRQRIAIARALIIRPKLIVLDEALSALDLSTKKKIINLLKKLSSEFKLSYLFVSHDLNLVSSIASRVIIMHKGKIVEEGNTKEILGNPKTEYTRKLMIASPKMPSYQL